MTLDWSNWFSILPTGVTNDCSPRARLCGEFTEPRLSNLMFRPNRRVEDVRGHLSAPGDGPGNFYPVRNVLDSNRVRVPFGIAQIGKAFRNEVTPRNFTFRSREFEQMEIEFFIHPSEAAEWYQYWRDTRFRWWQSIGLAART